MAEIRAATLGRGVGVEPGFFAGRGASMLALRLTADVPEEFDLDLPVRLGSDGRP